MSITVQKFRTSEASLPFFKQVDRLFDQIRQRAFCLFEERGFSPGRDIEDWLTAEREILWSPPVDLIENEKEFRARIAAPGFEAKEIQVTALPDAIVVQAESERKHENLEGEVRISELGSRKLYRRVDLPSPIDLDKTTATLDEGVLHLVAAEAAQPKKQKIHVATAGQSV
jgi:HSP20 family protein